MRTESSSAQDSVEVLVRGVDGNIKTVRCVVRKFGREFEFMPNKFYINLLNNGLTPYRIQFLMGTWTLRKK